MKKPVKKSIIRFMKAILHEESGKKVHHQAYDGHFTRRKPLKSFSQFQ
ncbi:hypothetical protein ACFVAD_06000 [Sutcliffiella sp. NPDC057660]